MADDYVSGRQLDREDLAQALLCETGRLFELAVGQAESVGIRLPVESAPAGTIDALWQLDVHKPDGPSVYFLGRSLLEALQAATHTEPVFVCTSCKASKKGHEFPRDASRPGGRFPHCHVCNRENVRRRKEARKGQRAKFQPPHRVKVLVTCGVCGHQKSEGKFPPPGGQEHRPGECWQCQVARLRQDGLTICLRCGKAKGGDEFSADTTRSSGQHPYCRDCRDIMRRARYERAAGQPNA